MLLSYLFGFSPSSNDVGTGHGSALTLSGDTVFFFFFFFENIYIYIFIWDALGLQNGGRLFWLQ